jgi:hypothetical protein
VLIGIDLDNTIACYDEGFLALAREMGLVSSKFQGGKKAVRDAVRSGTGGDVAWQQLQARLYGREIQRAKLAAGMDVLLERARQRNIAVAVISHKTQFSPYDADTDLRIAAKEWMRDHGLFDPRRTGVRPENVFFESTRQAKIDRIRSLGCTHFIDDLDEVFNEPDFPSDVQSYLYAAGYDEIPCGRFRVFHTHAEIADHLLGVDPVAAAAVLTGKPDLKVTPVSGGGNNRLYRVATVNGVFALKSYPSPDDDARDRLGTEYDALSFLRAAGEDAIPAPISMSRPMRVALYGWIDGEPIANPTAHDIDTALAFLRRLHGYRMSGAAAAMPLASEACLSVTELLRQISVRQDKLSGVAAGEPRLSDFLVRFVDVRNRLQERADADRRDELALAFRTLSPSDFGFHNALRDRGGRVVFLDFEYFGWDDPVKLTADFLLHPGMALDATARRGFAGGMANIHGDDPDFCARLRRHLPLYALRWCLILLNEFLPERWARRAVAGGGDNAAAKARQLAKAEAMLGNMPRLCEDLQ